MSMPMQRLVYSSTATGKVTLRLIESILSKAVANNARNRLTGLLLSSDDRFLQVLEGPGDALSRVVGKVLSDTRHKDVLILLHEWIEERAFSTWSMEGVFLDEWPKDERDRLVARYGRQRLGVQIPNEPHQAMSLLLDVEAALRGPTPQAAGRR